jgi:hypothetical protein
MVLFLAIVLFLAETVDEFAPIVTFCVAIAIVVFAIVEFVFPGTVIFVPSVTFPLTMTGVTVELLATGTVALVELVFNVPVVLLMIVLV